MTRLPVVSGRDAVRAFERAGYEADHTTGSHIILRHVRPPHRRLSIPDHKELARGTLRALIRDAGMTVDEFAALLIDTSKPQADNLIARLRQSLERHNQVAGRGYEITFSYGIVEFDPARHLAIEALLADADALMYEHKRSTSQQ